MKQNNFRAEAITASANIEKIHLIYTKIEEDLFFFVIYMN